MRGDFTRSTFHSEKRYRGVLMQQGRVQLDADWNEELDILAHLEDTTRIDEIGSCGVPKENAGFGISVTPDMSDLTISSGRLYADGILCDLDATAVRAADVQAGQVRLETLVADGREFARPQWIAIFDTAASPVIETLVRITDVDLPSSSLTFAPGLDTDVLTALTGPDSSPAIRRVVTYTTQLDLPAPILTDVGDETDPPTLDVPDGTFLAYADVWLRPITALDDDLIRESALGGPDTSIRTQVIPQVRLTPVDPSVTRCEDVPDWGELFDGPSPSGDRQPSTGRLSARSQPSPPTSDPCIIPPTAGYRRLENQLYRVEVHTPGPLGTATFVWSRENGSIATLWTGPTGQTGDTLTVSSAGRDSVLGFASGQLVELIDDTRELQGLPGTLATLTQPPSGQTLVIDTAVDRSDFPGNPKVRRWDSAEETLVTVPTSNGGFLPLEDGVEVRFENGHYNVGDYWLIPARTPKGDVEWPEDGGGRPISRGPDGIRHHYCQLALLLVQGGSLAVLDDCRETFPSLTTISAEDIGVDNGVCDLPGVETVQDAIDALCEESTLRRHKKHLHGWGIVCGLQVDCGPDDNVMLRDGYAIDCEGNDVVIAADEAVDVLRMVADFDATREEGQRILTDGRGEACLTIALNPDREGHSFAVEPYDPSWNETQSILAGTLYSTFYNECISPVVEFLKQEVHPPEEDGRLPATPAHQREAILAGLLAHVLNPSSGQTIYVSEREDTLLREFYGKLRDLLQSETFCAMFDNARAFPAYEGMPKDMDTVFGRGHHIRVRLRPGAEGSQEAYTVGPGLNPFEPVTRIDRYDLEKRVLLAQIDPISGSAAEGGSTSGTAGAVADIAFSEDGSRIYMVAPTRNGENTFFRVGDVRADGISWGTLVMLCGAKLVTLATWPGDPKAVYAVGLGTGLYRIDLEDPDTSLPLLGQGFTASGHLRITADGRAVATAEPAGKDPTSYTRIVTVDIAEGSTSGFEVGATGHDDIAVAAIGRGERANRIYCVVGPDTDGKRLMEFDIDGSPVAGDPDPIPLEDTPVSLEVDSENNALLITLEKANALVMVDLSKHRLVPGYAIPTQVAPVAVGFDGIRRSAYVLNYVSNTLTVVPRESLDPDFEFPFKILAAYRKAILEALADLLAGFLQYLKDCLCHHLLVNCPECSGDEKLYLACISIREGSVYNVCNFSRRRYVKSFPTVGYWISIVPFAPFLRRWIEQLCCMILPELFGRYQAAEYDRSAVGVASGPDVAVARTAVVRTQAADVPGKIRLAGQQTKAVASAGAAAGLRRMAAAPSGVASLAGVIGQPVDTAHTRLEERGLQVERAPFESLGLGDIVRSLTGIFQTPDPGGQVTLLEDRGTVKMARVTRPAESAELGPQVEALTRTVRNRERQVDRLRARLEEMEARSAALADAGVSAERIARLESELTELRGLAGSTTEKKPRTGTSRRPRKPSG
jgi:Family of unknown function (DUF6519)